MRKPLAAMASCRAASAARRKSRLSNPSSARWPASGASTAKGCSVSRPAPDVVPGDWPGRDAGLSAREAEVVALRFGLTDGRPPTLEEVGKDFGVTRERIRQIESKTLAKLRHPLRSDRLRDYLD